MSAPGKRLRVRWLVCSRVTGPRSGIGCATRVSCSRREDTLRHAILLTDGQNHQLPGRLAAEITLADRMTRCGHPGCRCHADPPRLHGPYHQWTRKKNRRTATRILTDDQLADYAPWFDNHRRLRELITELEELSLAIAEADPRWNR